MIRYAIILTLLVPAFARTEEPKKPSEMLLIRLASIETLLDQGEYLGKLFDQEESAKQAIGFLRAAQGEKGIDGVDTKRPIALCASRAEGISVPIYLMIPIADAQAFQEDLFGRRLRIELKKEENQIRSFQLSGIPVNFYLRFANNYAYLTVLDPSHLAETKLPSPKIIGEVSKTIFDFTMRFDAIPEQLKIFVLGQSEAYIAPQKQKENPKESKSQRELRLQVIDTLVGGLKSLLMETKQISFQLSIDPKTEEFGFDWDLVPVEGSKLAKDIASFEQTMNLFGAIGKNKVMFRSSINLSLPPSLKKSISNVVDEATEQILKQAIPGTEKKAEDLIKALIPTLKATDYDNGIAVFGPDKDGHLSILSGGRVIRGSKLEEAIKAILKEVPAEIANYVELDVEKVEGAGIHKLKVSDFINEELGRIFDKDTNIWFTIAEDRYFVFLGPNGVEELKTALTTKPSKGKIIETSVSVAKFAPYFQPEKAEAIKAVAETIFGKKEGSDRITASLSGGSSLRWTIRVSGRVLTFISAIQGGE
jgi:hypothetical protein